MEGQEKEAHTRGGDDVTLRGQEEVDTLEGQGGEREGESVLIEGSEKGQGEVIQGLKAAREDHQLPLATQVGQVVAVSDQAEAHG